MISTVAWVLGMLVLVSLPALCFLGLFRLIDYMAHDELVARFERGKFGTESPTGEATLSVDPASSVSAVRGERTVTCSDCGAKNRRSVTYCRHCLSEL